ncbi:CopG family ribbon-helix-helix protein [Variibacter gotjawalensis]
MFGLRLGKDLSEPLDKAARKLDQTRSALIRTAIREWLARNGHQKKF